MVARSYRWFLDTQVPASQAGKEAIDAFGIIPFYFGVLIHDRWGSYFLYDQCKHQVCGSHLLRDLTFVIDSNNYRWARLMKKLLCEICDEVNKSETKVLSEAECRRYLKRYRTILTQGGKEMPKLLQRRDGKRGRIAQTDAHNLHKAMLILEESILRFMSDPDVSFTNNTGEQKNQDVKGQDQSLGLLPDRILRTGLVPDIKLPRFCESARIQSTRCHSNRA